MEYQAHTQREAAGLQAPPPQLQAIKIKKKHMLQEELNFLI